MIYSNDVPKELFEQIIKVAGRAGVEAYEAKREADKAERRDQKLRNTRLLLKKYREFHNHMDNAQFKKEQLERAMSVDWIKEMYDPHNRADQTVTSIRNSAVKTHIMLRHIDTMVTAYKTMCEKDGNDKMLRRFDAFYGRYIADKRVSYEKTAEKWDVDVRTITNDISKAISDFSALLFGVEWLDDYT